MFNGSLIEEGTTRIRGYLSVPAPSCRHHLRLDDDIYIYIAYKIVSTICCSLFIIYIYTHYTNTNHVFSQCMLHLHLVLVSSNYLSTYPPTYLHTHTHIYMYICTYIHIYIYIHRCMHAYIHTGTGLVKLFPVLYACIVLSLYVLQGVSCWQ